MRLRLRLVLLSVGLTLGTLLALAALVGVLLWRAEVGAVAEEVSAQADTLLTFARAAPGALPEEAEELLYRGGAASSALAYEDGRLVWAGGARGPLHLSRRAPLGTLPHVGPLDPAFLQSTAAERTVRVGTLLVASRRGGHDVVQVGRSLLPVWRTLERYTLVATCTGLLLAALAGWVTTLAVGRVLRPLELLAARVRHLDVAEPLPGLHETGEVGDLARALSLSLAELREQREREELFLANASHELRTPISALLAEVQHVRSRPRTPQEYRAALARAEQAALHLQELTGNLLTLTRAQRAPARWEADLLELAGHVVDRLQPLAAQRGLDLTLTGESTPAWVEPDLITRLLENLIGNALKFTPQGEVTVTVRPCGAVAEVLVEDSGPGVPEGAETLFEPFARGHAPGEGFGLGLAVVREVVMAHGGWVRLERRRQGGTCARVQLPRNLPATSSNFRFP
ncbi:HAMP domain-containing sensor histidine kinase [Deinococcus sp. S9]|uniref:sensor histidine kinase n=1 Tax=Deinococcus sp. S9 TaxID=2545754 RepID=UPI001055FFBA|nr:HAMP domain-containing sensor histidine kinase [Deinococcus sp. S9]TDE87473.1 HAMP domain-containing histidine kinase [Deinococcus sp. S9]